MQWLEVVYELEMMTLFRFSKVLEESFDVNGGKIPEKTNRMTFTVSKNLKLLKKLMREYPQLKF